MEYKYIGYIFVLYDYWKIFDIGWETIKFTINYEKIRSFIDLVNNKNEKRRKEKKSNFGFMHPKLMK